MKKEDTVNNTPSTNKPDEKNAEEIFNESIEGDGSRKTIISAMQEYAQQFTNFDVIKVDEMRTLNEHLQSQLHAKSEECERLRAINDNLHAQLRNERGFNRLDEQEGIDY